MFQKIESGPKGDIQHATKMAAKVRYFYLNARKWHLNTIYPNFSQWEGLQGH